METLTPPTRTKFFFPYLAYIWLGLAIHFQVSFGALASQRKGTRS